MLSSLNSLSLYEESASFSLTESFQISGRCACVFQKMLNRQNPCILNNYPERIISVVLAMKQFKISLVTMALVLAVQKIISRCDG